jgi:type II secretory pathway pseudopilin PulG
MDEPTQGRRFRFSIRSMMVVIALSAFLLALVAWTVQQQRVAIQAENRARMMAERAMREADRARQAAAQAQALQAQTNASGQPAEGQGPAMPSPGTAANANSPLWSGLSINHTVFRPEDLKSLTIEFTLVNDGKAPMGPKIAQSRIIVNGQELAESSRLLGSEPRVARPQSLPPGELLRFALPLGDLFRAPGTYRVYWRGEDFQSPEVSFRVLPEKAR